MKATIVSDKMIKSRVVELVRYKKVPLYAKYVKVRKRCTVHDSDNSTCLGDIVEITSCRPMSRKKRFVISKIITRSSHFSGDTSQ